MGASTSTEQGPTAKQREIETLAASTGALPMLQNSFSKLADPQGKTIPFNSLQKCFSVIVKNTPFQAPMIPRDLPGLLDQLGPSIVELFFVADKEGFSWIEFVSGYVGCCGRMPTTIALRNLIRVFLVAAAKAGLSLKLQVESVEDDFKISGSLLPAELQLLLLMSWVLHGNSINMKFSSGEANICLPDVCHSVFSAVASCTEAASNLNLWESDISNMEFRIPAAHFQKWVLKTVPHLAGCFSQFVHARLQCCKTSEDGFDSSSLSLHSVSSKTSDPHILTCGRAWAISLTQQSNEEIIRVCFPSNGDGTNEHVLYRSSLHGKGLNRFWSKIEGYDGPVLILISASSAHTSKGNGNVREWIIGALVQQSLENRDMFYGSSGNLFAICPVFNAISPSGREKNFVYSHLHPSGRIYEPRPKPVGIAFGGTIGNERVFVDEDFAKVTIRHHAVDKTYGPGFLIPDQGFLPVQALVLEVEVWGLGGKKAIEVQSAYKEREQLFTEQRRKVDLKTFGNWEDSPEKAMMDMVADPNQIRREDR